jgi:hypothetical protein
MHRSVLNFCRSHILPLQGLTGDAGGEDALEQEQGEQFSSASNLPVR